MEELKPCPFCGRKAVLNVEYGSTGRPVRYKIICQNYSCGAMVVRKMPTRGPNRPKTTLDVFGEKYGKRLDAFNSWCDEMCRETINAWNRRANDGTDETTP